MPALFIGFLDFYYTLAEHNLPLKYENSLSKVDFRKLEQLCLKKKKTELDLTFLKNCRTFNVFSKFTCLNIPNVNYHDGVYIKRRLLKGAIREGEKEKKKIDSQIMSFVLFLHIFFVLSLVITLCLCQLQDYSLVSQLIC